MALKMPQELCTLSLTITFCSIVSHAYLFQFGSRRLTEEDKTHSCAPMQTQQKEKSKRKNSDIFKETTTNYDVP